MPLNVALIGFGLAGASFHAPLIASEPRLRLARVVTSREDAVAAAWPHARATHDTDTALTDPAIHLVVIASPNDTHAQLARDALLAGKHVVVDKPFAADPREGADLIALARDRGRMLTVFHNRRWDGDFLTVAGLVADGRLGEIMLASFHWDRFRPDLKQGWKEVPGDANGLISDLGTHLVDQAIRLFGYPDALQGDVIVQRRNALVDDYFEITLHYGARRVILSGASLIAAARPRFALHGRAGSFVKYGIDPQESHIRAGGTPDDAEHGVDAPENYGILTDPDGVRETIPTQRGDWRLFYQGVASAILDGAAPPVDPADALGGLFIIESARRSAREGRLLRFTLPEAALK